MTNASAAYRTRKRNTLALCIALALGASASAVAAPGVPTPQAIIAVTNCNDSGPGSLRAAAAMSGAVVADLSGLSCSSISLSSAIDVSAQQLIVEGPGADALTIDGNYNGRVFHAAGNLTLKGVSVTHGAAPTSYKYGAPVALGGCIKAGQGVLIEDSVISGCRADDPDHMVYAAFGGGIEARAITLYNSTITDCSVYAYDGLAIGGGAFSRDDIAVHDSTIMNNTAAANQGSADGGGVYSDDDLSMYGSTLSGNVASSVVNSARGGGFSGEGLTMVHSTITNNTVSAAGGGDACGGGAYSYDADLNYSTIAGNVAQAQMRACGGGIQADVRVDAFASTIAGNLAKSDTTDAQGGGVIVRSGDIELRASTVSDNTVRADQGTATGGGLHSRELRLTNATVANNSALSSAGSGIGGGVYIENASSWVYNSTVAGNSATTAAGGIAVPLPGTNPYTATLKSAIVYSNSAAGGASDLAPASASSVTVAGDHALVGSVDAFITLPTGTLRDDPLLRPLADNGGPTETMALGDASPAIDTGSNPNNLIYDQRGPPYARRFGVAVDIGAFEVQQPGGDIIFRSGFE